MKIISRPKNEENILVMVKNEASAVDIHRNILSQAQHSVVYLCQCGGDF
ncbi:MAG: hypothetical protein HQM10_12170 [Candidatus Riflebacteria bacterium]|nr:hypothetical protein [Candidatus Riflebacteria bacterium]